MTDLTEQWKKNKLPEGDYYIKKRNGYLPYDNIDSYGVWRNSIDDDIVEVLAPMPSYEEWQASENYIDYLKQCISVYESKEKQHTDDAIAYNELTEENEKLKERNESLNNRDIKLCRIANEIRDENFALKELLKRVVNATNFYHEIKTASVIDYGVWYNIAIKINQVLGEDK